MPSFTCQVANLRRTGPVCQVRIGVSQAKADLLKQQNKPIPAPVEITALIDTGASGTAVKPEVIRQLQLTPRGVTNIATPSSATYPCNVYDVSLTFPNGVGIAVITVIEVPLEGQIIQGFLFFPEGTRSPTGQLQRFRKGIEALVQGKSYPIIPAYLQGTHEALAKGRLRPQAAIVRLRIGLPERFQDALGGEASAIAIANYLQARVHALGRSEAPT